MCMRINKGENFTVCKKFITYKMKVYHKKDELLSFL